MEDLLGLEIAAASPHRMLRGQIGQPDVLLRRP